MREERRARFDGHIVPELQLGRVAAGGEPLEPPTHAGRELGGIPEAHRLAHVARGDKRERRASRRIKISHDHRSLGLALLCVGENLARPHGKPAVGQLDLAHRKRAGIGQREQQRVRIR